MTTTLTDRYVHTAMRTVPDKQRADLSTELRGSIEDQIDARVEQGEPRESAERTVLTELGDPDELAARYLERPLQLIGPRYFLAWWRLLKLLWVIVPLCAAFGVALGMTLAGEPFGAILGSVVGVTVSVIVHVGFWTTLVFFVVERSATGSGTGPVSEWTPDDLPESAERRASLGDLIASLVFLAVAAGAVLWDRFVGLAYLGDTGEWVPFLHPALWPWGIGILLALIVLEALHAIWVYARDAWTMPAAIVNAALNLAIAVPAMWLLIRGELLNPDFFPSLIPDGAGETVQAIVTTIVGFVIVGVVIWDAVDGFWKARRSRIG